MLSPVQFTEEEARVLLIAADRAFGSSAPFRVRRSLNQEERDALLSAKRKMEALKLIGGSTYIPPHMGIMDGR
jgi:hypothetical protein